MASHIANKKSNISMKASNNTDKNKTSNDASVSIRATKTYSYVDVVGKKRISTVR